MDLVVWFDRDDAIVGFQLAYDGPGLEHALTWKLGSGYRHERVDDGEGRPGKYKAAPILLADGDFSASTIAERFRACAAGIEGRIADFVYIRLLEFPG